jgi:hypothetical protein
MVRKNAEVKRWTEQVYEAEGLLIAALELQASLQNRGLPTEKIAELVRDLDIFAERWGRTEFYRLVCRSKLKASAGE